MSSPGLKRPLDFDMPHSCSSSGTNTMSGTAANGGKRRCTTLQQQSRNDLSSLHNNSPFKDASIILNPLSEDISSVIEDEIHKSHDIQCNGSDTKLLLTVNQTQAICERLVKDREQRLRDEYDRILACKLAEQYDLLTKVNYLNSYVEPRLPSTLSPSSSNPSLNAFAAAFNTMHRSAATAAASPASSLPDLGTFAASLTGNGHPSTLSNSHLAAFNMQQQAAAVLQAQQRTSVNANQAIPSGPVLLASNLDEQLATPEALFTLFGVFGDVIRVKILFNKKDNALVQMADSNQAQVAQGYLDKQKVFGKIIRVTRSKHQLVQMPRDCSQSDAGLTKDFTNSPLHRFKFPGSRNYMNIYPPSNTLHISNIPATIGVDDIRKAFADACGFEYSSFKFFPKDRKMALMKFNSIEQATIALIKMHNFQISDENNLRVSFSKSIGTSTIEGARHSDLNMSMIV